MNKEEFIKQRCEIDKITEEEFERTYRVVECNCGKIYCKGYRCLDLNGLLKENRQLKNNWNELKKDIGYELLKLREPDEYNKGLCNAFTYINSKMQELEQESDSNE